MFSKGKKFIGIILSLIFVVVLAGCTNKKTSTSSDKLNIVTTTDFYGEVAKKIVGNKGSVTSIISNPAVDPHDFEPTTKTAQIVSKANVTVANGLGYDSWMNKLDKQDGTYVKIGEDVMDKKTGDNPHIWYNPQTMPKYAQYLADELSKQQPKNKKYFQENAKKYIASLKPVKAELSKLKTASQKVTDKEVYVSEPVFDYSIKATGFKVGNKEFEKAVENGTDPTPQTIKTMQDNIKAKKIAFFVLNTQTDSKLVNNLVDLAKKNDIPVLEVTETLPKDKTYTEWMLSQYKAMNKILQGEK